MPNSSNSIKCTPGTRFFATHEQMPADLAVRLDAMALEYGRQFDSYNITEPNRQYFWTTDLRGVIGLQIVENKYAFVAGGLICAAEDRDAVVQDIVAFAQLNALTVALFSIDPEAAGLFEQHNFRVTKLGEETTIPLNDVTWSGKAFEWVRRQFNYVKRHGIEFHEIHLDNLSADAESSFRRQLANVDTEFLRQKVQKESIPLFEGELIPGHSKHRRLFVAAAKPLDFESRIEGYAVCNPMLHGRQWSIETYRARQDAVRGTIPFLFRSIIDRLQEEGVESVSLCPIMALRCQTPRRGDSWLLRRILAFWYNHANLVYDSPALFHFKSRFRPAFSDVFVCVYPRASLGLLQAYSRCTKLESVPLRSVAGALRKRLSSRTLRKNLASPK